MLDLFLRPVIDPPLNALGRFLAGAGITANTVTGAGLVFSAAAGVTIALGAYGVGLVLVLASRLTDGLDGAVARATRPTDWGGYADIVADFAFYGGIPLAFAWADPAAAWPAVVLLAAFYLNAASFLGYAVLAEKRGMVTKARGRKAWYHAGGLMEGSETIAFFVAFCLWPQAFAPLAYAFALLTAVTAVARVIQARRDFPDQG